MGAQSLSGSLQQCPAPSSKSSPANPDIKKLRQADWPPGALRNLPMGSRGGGVVPPLYASSAAPLGPTVPSTAALCPVPYLSRSAAHVFPAQTAFLGIELGCIFR